MMIDDARAICRRYPATPVMVPAANPLTRQVEMQLLWVQPEVDVGTLCGEWLEGEPTLFQLPKAPVIPIMRTIK